MNLTVNQLMALKRLWKNFKEVHESRIYRQQDIGMSVACGSALRTRGLATRITITREPDPDGRSWDWDWDNEHYALTQVGIDLCTRIWA
ncbi:MAG: hypothetical protein V3U14_12910 [candidate division NC10 bacterium]